MSNRDKSETKKIMKRLNVNNSFEIKKTSLVTIMILACLNLFVFTIAGQTTSSTDGTTPAGLTSGSPAGAYSLNGFDNINLYNGNLNFALPLLKTGGRGSSTAAMMLTMDSKKWQVEKSYDRINDEERFMPKGLWSPSSGYEPGLMQARQVSVQWAPSACLIGPYGNYLPWPNRTLSRLTFTSPDGTEHEFRDQQTNGQPLPLVNCQTGASRGTVFITADGSDMTFISDVTVVDYVGKNAPQLSISGYLMLHDGTRYRIDNGNVSWIRDRNGNTLNFARNTDPNSSYYGAVTTTDSLNRQVTHTYQPSGSYNEINFQGFGGATRTIRVNSTSLSNALRSGFTIQNLRQLFPELNGPARLTIGAEPYNPTVVSSVTLPNNLQYQFFYNSYGELARIVSPTGGAIEYDMAPGSGVIGDLVGQAEIYRRIVERRVYANGGTGNNYSEKTTFNVSYGGSSPSEYTAVTVDQYNTVDLINAGKPTILSRQKHYFNGNPNTTLLSFYNDNVNNLYSAWTEGQEYKTEAIAPNLAGAPVLQRVEKTWQQTSPSWWTGAVGSAPSNNPHLIQTVITLVDTNQVAKTTSVNPNNPNDIGFDQFGNQTDVYEYDYGSGQPGTFKRRSHTDYLYNTNYTAYTGAHLRGLPIQTWVSSDVNGTNKASLSQIEYDNYTTDANHAGLLTRANVAGFDAANFGVTNTRRGNATAVTTYGNAQNLTESVTAYSQYDILGNVVKTIDPKGYVSTIDYVDSFGSPDANTRTTTAPTQLNGQSTFAFPTSAINALGWTTGYTQFDYFTGAAVDSEDINGNVSSAFYNDLLNRPTQTITANNQANQRNQQTFVYDDANRRVTVTSDLFAFGDNLSKTESYYDGLGKPTENRKYETNGGYVVSKTEYDAQGRAYKSSNLYRPSEINTNNPVFWTTSSFDDLGRVIKIKMPDNAEVNTSYLGNTATVTDQALKQRRSVTNALGQLVRVDEPNDQGQLDVSGVPAQPTTYAYDTLNNLTNVTQGLQTRSFVYDSLSKLKSATNPESGLIQYTYDANGNLQTKRNDRGIKTVYDYDALNRVLNKCYRVIGTGALGATSCAAANETAEPNTADVNYFYDNLFNAKGKLIKISSSVSMSEYTSFDTLGRVLTHKQTTDGVAYTTSYGYNLSGALASETYPSGRVIKNVIDLNGDLSIVQSKKNSTAGFWNYAEHFSYTATGAVSSMQLGNNKWESTQFNSRLQPTQIALGTVQNGTDNLKLNYTYNSGEQNNNNGNVLSQTITVPTSGQTQGFMATQSYTYDSLNRLKSATEMIGTQTWKQTFLYDRYGNRNFDVNNTTTLGSCSQAQCNPAVDVTNNQFTTGQGYTYDFAGNVVTDAQGQSFTFDGENKQTKITSGGQPIGKYFYDGDGKRVKKVVGAEVTIFVYDAGGKMVAEYSTTVASSTEAKVSYLTSDGLGSPRITTDAIGMVISRRDFMPFGEEITRTGYGSDSVRQKFTSYERDNESQLDFAEARVYQNKHGRFTSVDPFNPVADSENQKEFDKYIRQPKNWNRYAYVWNNPLSITDPNGEKVYIVFYTTGNSTQGEDDAFRRAAETHGKDIVNSKGFDPTKDHVYLVGVKTKEDFVQALGHSFDKSITDKYGKVAQVAFYGHGGRVDGPIFRDNNGLQEQFMRDSSEASRIKINWGTGAEARFYMCNGAETWAQDFANQQGVKTWGYENEAYFSNSPTQMIPDQGTDKPLYLIDADYGHNSPYGRISQGLYVFGFGSVRPMVSKSPTARGRPVPNSRPYPTPNH